jgi:hypothetical protein
MYKHIPTLSCTKNSMSYTLFCSLFFFLLIYLTDLAILVVAWDSFMTSTISLTCLKLGCFGLCSHRQHCSNDFLGPLFLWIDAQPFTEWILELDLATSYCLFSMLGFCIRISLSLFFFFFGGTRV